MSDAYGGEFADVTIETTGLTMLGEKSATPTLRTGAKEPVTEEPSMTGNDVPVSGRLPLESTVNVPRIATAPDTQSAPALGVPDGLLTVSSNVPAVCV